MGKSRSRNRGAGYKAGGRVVQELVHQRRASNSMGPADLRVTVDNRPHVEPQRVIHNESRALRCWGCPVVFSELHYCIGCWKQQIARYDNLDKLWKNWAESEWKKLVEWANRYPSQLKMNELCDWSKGYQTPFLYGNFGPPSFNPRLYGPQYASSTMAYQIPTPSPFPTLSAMPPSAPSTSSTPPSTPSTSTTRPTPPASAAKPTTRPPSSNSSGHKWPLQLGRSHVSTKKPLEPERTQPNKRARAESKATPVESQPAKSTPRQVERPVRLIAPPLTAQSTPTSSKSSVEPTSTTEPPPPTTVDSAAKLLNDIQISSESEGEEDTVGTTATTKKKTKPARFKSKEIVSSSSDSGSESDSDSDSADSGSSSGSSNSDDEE